MRRIRNAAELIMMLLTIACTPDPLPVKNIPVLKSEMVVASQVLTDQSVIVMLTKSIGALDAGKDSDLQNLISRIIVEDAIVTITYGEKTDTLRYLGEGLYGSIDLPIAPGQSYALRASSPSNGEVSSNTKAQEAVPFKTVEASLYKEQSDSLAQIEYSLTDPPGKNFYMINIQRFSITQDLSSLINPRIYTHLVTDENFDGQVFEEKFNVLFQRYHLNDTVVVSLTNISEDYYQYMKVRVDNRFSVTSFATEPFNYPTNVTGGYGFFNLQKPDFRVFVLK